MNSFRCKIAAIDTGASFAGQITIQHEGERLTLPIRPLSLYKPWIKTWKVGDEVICHVNNNRSCGLSSGTNHIDPLPVDDAAYKTLQSWASAPPEKNPLHGGDTVEEIATKRQGKIDGVSDTPPYWRVHFSDGKDPVLQIFKDENELRLIKCPHTESGKPGVYPAHGIMEPEF